METILLATMIFDQVSVTRQVIINLHHGGNIVVQTFYPEEEVPFDGFSELLGEEVLTGAEVRQDEVDVELIPPGAFPSEASCFFQGQITKAALASDRHILVCGFRERPKNPQWYHICIWQSCLRLAGMHAILRGENVVFAHCAALETERGVVLLFGESGMGKSTASARWRAHGGKCISDDMVLLDFSGGETVYVRRMPTWSACREGKNKWNYPAGEELPLIGVLALGRNEGGHDEIVEISMAQFYAQCYRSMFYWNLFTADKLPEEMRKRLVDCIRRQTNIITGKYPPRALLTVLEGNPIPVIASYLKSLGS